MVESNNSFYLFGPIALVRSGYTLNPSAIWLRFFHSQAGTLSGDVAAQVGTSVGGYFTSVSARVFCEYDFGTVPKESPLILDVNVQQTVFADTASGRVKIYASSLYAGGVLDSACQVNSVLFCNSADPASSRVTNHLLGSTGVSITPDGVVAGEQEFEWSQSPIAFNDTLFNSPGDGRPYEPENITTATTGWEVSGDYPFSKNITLQASSSCQPSAPCDCTQSLDGMTVTFEGQEFNYGSLDNFFNAGTWWEETSAGVFRRRDTEPCDGSLNQTVKQATIECTQINGVDTWVCYLDHTCEERDDLTCPGPPDASRNKQWTGIFECDENGKPTGSPGSLEVDSDTTSGTPAVECVSALNVPSISISAPP
jgi:hypothetical protein